MAVRNTTETWGVLARALHWAMALLIPGLLALGLYMVQVLGDDPGTMVLRFELTQTHKSFGFVAFALAVVRIGWRWSNATPAVPSKSRLTALMARVGHLALYGCMVVLPVSGWLMASASPMNDPDAFFPVKNMVFGMFELPDPFPRGDEVLSDSLGAVHFYAAMMLIVLVMGHVAAALKHHFVDRDMVLRRMIRS
ncbi:MAG: cytochrome b [Pseudomonadota bacterium]